MFANAIVFVVDDDPSVCRSLARLIRSAGLEVATFPSAQAFLDCQPPDRPGCLVLDLQMPGVNGLDLQDELRRADRRIPIVFLTGQGNVPSTARAMKNGAVDFMEKPAQDEQLLDALRRAIARDRRERADRAERAALRRRIETLTPREREVLSLVVAGHLNKQIAARLGTREGTVKVHRARVMEKMQADSVAELTLLAARIGVSAPCSQADAG